MKRKIGLILTGILFLTGVAVSANAAVITYNDEASFLGDAGTLNYESFESIAAGAASPVVTTNFTVTGDLTVQNFVQGGLHATDGITYVNAGFGTDVVFTFDSKIDSFAFWFTDFGDFGSGTTLTFSNNGAIVEEVAVGPYADGTDLFWGLISDDALWDQVTLSNSAASDNWSFDEVYSGVTNNPVPEPSTVLLFGIGILGLAGVSRKKST